VAAATAVGTVQFGECLAVLSRLPAGEADLIYVDPPFNTGRRRRQARVRSRLAGAGGGETADGRAAPDRMGFGGKRYVDEVVGVRAFDDAHADYLGWLEPRLVEAHRVLARHGTLYFHIDYREAHYCKVLLDALFGRECFLNEIIWAYDFGGRPRRRWPAKHDTILVYVRDRRAYHFDAAAVERIPYMAPGLVTPEKAARGKLPTDTWWHTIVPTSGRERTGYPTQKPLGVLRRIVAASSRPGDLVLDFCAGSGTAGVAAQELGRRFHLVDNNPEALAVMAERFRDTAGVTWIGWDPERSAPPGG
jgi:site-specific DNA-methyltransferase (adenine-specific)